ncbi:farnesol dehydrogenase-like isoform X1 [Nomia melanderi]|uniref:farnesol dehydrogenase-like isoform X1 n=1 Tax=Nomia melanderi TaxID=2448451 RepID=UPI003FCCA495
MHRWAGKVAIVTGASSGIGSACAKLLAGHGVKVVGLARRKQRLEELTKQLGRDKFVPIQCDLSKEEDILKAFGWVEDNLGGVDILINNAGVVSATMIIETPTEEYRRILDVNLIAPAICAREFAKSIRKRNACGHIINIDSILGRYTETVPKIFNMYAISKAGLIALRTELRHEMIQSTLNVKVTSISPGLVYTEMSRNTLKVDEFDKKIPMLHDKDVADTVIQALSAADSAEIFEITVIPRHVYMGLSIPSGI